MVNILHFQILVSYYLSDIQDYFKYIVKKYETLTDKSQVQIHVKKFKAELHLRLKRDTILNFRHQELQICLEALKEK